MEFQDRDATYKTLIADLLKTKTVTAEQKTTINNLLSNFDNDENIYLIYTLQLLNLLSPEIELKIINFNLNRLMNYLSLTKSNNECCCQPIEKEIKNDKIYRDAPPDDYIPLTEEEAYRLVFKETPTLTWPEKGQTKRIQERFSFIDDKENVMKQCIRIFIINDCGEVVEYHGEKVKDYDSDSENFYAGVLKDKYCTVPENDL